MKRHEFQVGDLVRIREKETMPKQVSFAFTNNMKHWSGREFVIYRLHRYVDCTVVRFVGMSPSMCRWIWTTDMIELVNQTPKSMSISTEEVLSLLNSSSM